MLTGGHDAGAYRDYHDQALHLTVLKLIDLKIGKNYSFIKHVFGLNIIHYTGPKPALNWIRGNWVIVYF